MNRKLIALIALVALAGSGAFAQIAVGVSGAIYRDDADLSGASFAQAWKDLRHGAGYLGFLGEVGMDHVAVGLAVNFNSYTESFGPITGFDMKNVDVNLYLQGHLFKYKSFLDPFLEIGAGEFTKDYKNKNEDPDTSNPLQASWYGDVGFGLGLNLGSLGFFLKGLYNIEFNDQPAQGSYKDELGVEHTFDLAEYPISNLKFLFGAKVIL
jgi:hypothetical protein